LTSVSTESNSTPGQGDGIAAVRAPRIRRRALADVLVFSIIDWHFRIQRPQHLAREFARAGHRVYFFSNHFEDSSDPGFLAECLDNTLPLYQIKLKVNKAPAIYFAEPTGDAIAQILAGIQMFYDWSGIDRSWSLVQHAYWYPVAMHMQSECLTYDCMDHHEGFGNVPQGLLDLEYQMMRRADLIVATSSWLGEHAHKYNRHVEVIRNAGQYTDFCDAPPEHYVDPRGRTIIGYYGAMAEWFDVDLIARVAQAFPDALILLVGADTAGVKARLKALTNIEMTGEVPYARLPYYLYSFDVCMLPFKVIPLTLATNPVKVYEYLGAGRSVVSVDLPEMAQFGRLVRLAGTHDGFIEQLREALMALPDRAEVVEQRRTFAAGQTWSHRVQEFSEAVIALPRPKVSAIVLTYNNLELTRDCLDSLEKNSDDVELEIVVVDNASSDGSPAYLSSWAASRPNVKLILNNNNRGFAAGNNQGLAVASGDYLVILNNDTVVTRHWAQRMVNHLRNDSRIGIIGPLTNNIGNEARINTGYTTLDAMHAEAGEITMQSLGRCFELDTVAFFCAMLPRGTYERCGPISEDYGVGFFEDDDYCRQVQAAGLVVACAEDVFVHHHLSASFNKLGEERKRKLFEANRAIYEAKWGSWIPHRYRDSGVKQGRNNA
jgi:GT2 family glycosyltransferase